jgi:hypothetical protein
MALGFALAWPTVTAADQQKSGQPSQQYGGSASGQRNLEDRVVARLADRGALASIEVRTNERGEVTLSGSAPSERAKQRALRTVRQTPGVRDVKDQVKVEPRMARTGATRTARLTTETASPFIRRSARAPVVMAAGWALLTTPAARRTA